jgi:hypothetical protein
MGMFLDTATSLSPKMVGTVFDTATTALGAQCVLDAENEIKKWIGKRYDLSDTTYFSSSTVAPPILRTLTQDLAIGYMYESSARGSKEGYARADRYIKRVMDNLKNIQDGTVALVDTTGTLVPESADIEWKVYENTSSYAPTFNEDSPKSWRVSRNKLNDISDERDE